VEPITTTLKKWLSVRILFLFRPYDVYRLTKSLSDR
jgi:hypothetical protein